MKRVTELSKLLDAEFDAPAGRGYHTSHRPVLMAIGALTSFAAIVVFAFYINAPATTLLYRNPQLLWLICPLILILLFHMWRHAEKGSLNEDPVLFAIADRVSLGIVVLSGLLTLACYLVSKQKIMVEMQMVFDEAGNKKIAVVIAFTQIETQGISGTVCGFLK